jgi:hypothetical protein
VQHEVTLSRGFWLADTACTQAFWQAVTGRNPSKFKDDPRNPVEQVSWDDVQAFIVELKRRLPGLQVRLPSEAEWEYACRAGTTTPFSFGDRRSRQSWSTTTATTPMPVVRRACIAEDGAGGLAAGESLGLVRDARQRLGVVRRLVRRLSDGRHRSTHKAHKVAATACCAAARGSTTAGTCVRPAVSGYEPGGRYHYSGSGSP